MKKNLYIHIGYHKTATTTLQKHFFPFLKDVTYLGKYFSGSEKFIFEISILQFDKGSKEIHNDELFKLIKDSSGIISEERIIDDLSNIIKYEDLLPSGLVSKTKVNDFYQFFDKKLFTVKVILTIRRQDQIIESYYAQVYRRRLSKISKLDTFKKFINDFLNENDFGKRDYYFYLNTILTFQEVFGKDNVLVLPYELFCEDKKKFLNKLAFFMNTEFSHIEFDEEKRENVRVTANKGKRHSQKTVFHSLKIIRNILPLKNYPGWVKMLAEKTKNWTVPFQKNPGIIKIDPESRIKVLEIYAESNKQLDELLNLSLKKYGYY